MKYQLIPNDKHYNLITNQILSNRGIENPEIYRNLTDEYIFEYKQLDNIDVAISLLLEAIKNEDKIGIIVDSDVDGYCSASILYRYLEEIYEKEKIEVYFHNSKQHGLSKDILVSDDVKLLIIPDAGTNDVEQCKELVKKGVRVLILDHHESDRENPYAVIVNPFLCNYPNKMLSGCAVVYKFLQALDDELWESHADVFLDIVALSLISDGMDLKSYESRRLVDKGLNWITNRLFTALIDKQSYSMNGTININNIQFYITPLLNALVRSGTMEDKIMMFQAFIENYQTYPYKKRGETEETQEDIYTRVARLANNAKSKQNREIDKAIEAIQENIKKYNWDKNKVLFVNAEDLDSNYTGLVSMKLASQYSKPCVVLRENSWKQGFYGGSGRNFDGSPIEDLRDFLNGTGYFDFCQGHASAFGVSIDGSKIKKMIDDVNKRLEETSFERVWKVDFILDENELDDRFVIEMDSIKDIYCGGIPESLIAVTNIQIGSSEVQVLGKENNTWKFVVNGVEIIKFKCGQDDPMLELTSDWTNKPIKINIVGKPSISEFNGQRTCQIIVTDYDIIK